MSLKLSVIILNYNRRNDSLYLIDSLKKQNYKDFEIVFVDNASKDKSIESVKKKYPWVIVVPLEKNIGRAGHNEGARVANGEVLVFLDADMYFEPGFLGRVASKFKNKNINAVSFNMLDAWGKSKGWQPVYSPKGNKRTGFDSTFGGGMWAIRKKVFEKVGGFNPSFFVYVDEWEYLIRLWSKGFSVRYFPDLIGYHKESPYAYRSIMRGYHVIINHAQIYALYLPVSLWFKFLKHHAGEASKIMVTGEANRWGTIRGLILALFFFLKVLPKRNIPPKKALNKFLKYYFPKKGEVIVIKWGWYS